MPESLELYGYLCLYSAVLHHNNIVESSALAVDRWKLACVGLYFYYILCIFIYASLMDRNSTLEIAKRVDSVSEHKMLEN